MPSPTQNWGTHHEDLAETTLVRRGYQILERNWRGGGGELDRIAWDGDILCFIEVRARATADFGIPAQTVDRRKQQKLVRAAQAYLVQLPRPVMARFDVVSIVDDGQTVLVELYKNAFDAGR